MQRYLQCVISFIVRMKHSSDALEFLLFKFGFPRTWSNKVDVKIGLGCIYDPFPFQ